MKTIIALLLILFCATTFAQETQKGTLELMKIAQELKNENSKAEVDLDRVEAAYKKSNEEVKKIREELIAAQAEAKKNGQGSFEFSWNVTSDKLMARANSLRKVETARANLDKALKASSDAQKQMAELQIKSLQAVKGIEKAEADYKASSLATANVLKAQGLTIKFSDLQAKIGTVDQTLGYISYVYDQGTIGAYLKDKVGLLLNSQLFCEAKKRCDVPEPKRIENKKIEETLFKGSSASTSHGDYYNRVNSSNR